MPEQPADVVLHRAAFLSCYSCTDLKAFDTFFNEKSRRFNLNCHPVLVNISYTGSVTKIPGSADATDLRLLACTSELRLHVCYRWANAPATLKAVDCLFQVNLFENVEGASTLDAN